MLVDSQNASGVTILGPVAEASSWQARSADGFGESQFVVDWDRQSLTGPAGQPSISWRPSTSPQSGMMFEARFARRDGTSCLLRSRCTRAKREPRLIAIVLHWRQRKGEIDASAA